MIMAMKMVLNECTQSTLIVPEVLTSRQLKIFCVLLMMENSRRTLVNEILPIGFVHCLKSNLDERSESQKLEIASIVTGLGCFLQKSSAVPISTRTMKVSRKNLEKSQQVSR